MHICKVRQLRQHTNLKYTHQKRHTHDSKETYIMPSANSLQGSTLEVTHKFKNLHTYQPTFLFIKDRQTNVSIDQSTRPGKKVKEPVYLGPKNKSDLHVALHHHSATSNVSEETHVI